MLHPVSKHARGTAWPTTGLLVAALISGLYWLPLRHLERVGITGLWATVAIALVAGLPLMLPLFRWRKRTLTEWRDLTLIGLLLGGAYAFYAASLVLTDVVRAVLLFYIAPVWGTLLEISVLRRSLTVQRCASLVLGIGGLAVILGSGNGFVLTMNAGDALALASGIVWSVGLLLVFARSDLSIGDQIAAQAAGAAGVAVLVSAIGLAGASPPPLETVAAALPWLLFAAVLLTIPMWCLSLWAARHLTPGRTTLLFMIEVCIGVGSAALLSGDRFGWHEAAGTLLVISAALVELKPPSGSRRDEPAPQVADSA